MERDIDVVRGRPSHGGARHGGDSAQEIAGGGNRAQPDPAADCWRRPSRRRDGHSVGNAFSGSDHAGRPEAAAAAGRPAAEPTAIWRAGTKGDIVILSCLCDDGYCDEFVALSYETFLRLRLIFFAFDFRFRFAGLDAVAGPGAMASVALSLALRGDGPLAAFIICITMA